MEEIWTSTVIQNDRYQMVEVNWRETFALKSVNRPKELFAGKQT